MSPRRDAEADRAYQRRYLAENPAKRRETVRRSHGAPTEGRIACLLCGEEMHNLGHHLLAVHGITSKEYREQFPGTDLTSRHLRAALLDVSRDRTPGKPGARLWTATKVVVRIRRWYRRTGKVPMEDQWVRAAKDRPSAGTVKNIFGSWNAGIRAAGLPAREPTRPRPERRGKRLKPLPHGTISGYHYWKCRCPACTKANRDAKREQWRKRRADR